MLFIQLSCRSKFVGVLYYAPENGWELLKKDFGDPTAPVSAPFYALYNRYNGKIRFFVFYYEDTSLTFQNASILIEYDPDDEKHSDLMGLLNTPTNATEEFIKGVELETVNQYATDGVWLIAEMQTAFDPCACDHESTLLLSTRLVEMMNLFIEIEGTGQSTPIIEDGTAIAPGSDGYVVGVGNVINTISSGQKSYTTLKKFNDDLENIYDESDTDFFNLLSKFLKPLPFVGLALPFIELLVGGGGSGNSDITQVPGPVSFDHTFQFSGNGIISTGLDVQPIYLATPGSKNFVSGHEPIYNNILGVATVLETPVIYKKTIPYDIMGFPNDREVFRLSEDVVYAINNLAGISGQPVKARGALIFKTCETYANYVPFGNLGMYADVEPDESGEIIELRTPFMDLGCLSEYSPSAVSSDADALPGTYAGMRNCSEDIDLRIMLTLERGDNQGEEIVFIATYNTRVEEAPEDFDILPRPELLVIPETIEVGSVEEAEGLFAWNGITVTDDVTVTADNIGIISETFTEVITVTINPPNGESPYETQMEISPDIREGDVIEGGRIIIENTPSCREVGPANRQKIGKFCAERYDPRAETFRTPGNGNQAETSAEFRSIDGRSYTERVFPNPGSGRFRYTLSTEERQTVELEIFDGLGRSVKKFFQNEIPAGNHDFSFNLSEFPDGIYHLQVRKGNTITMHKIVKKAGHRA